VFYSLFFVIYNKSSKPRKRRVNININPLLSHVKRYQFTKGLNIVPLTKG